MPFIPAKALTTLIAAMAFAASVQAQECDMPSSGKAPLPQKPGNVQGAGPCSPALGLGAPRKDPACPSQNQGVKIDLPKPKLEQPLKGKAQDYCLFLS